MMQVQHLLLRLAEAERKKDLDEEDLALDVLKGQGIVVNQQAKTWTRGLARDEEDGFKAMGLPVQATVLPRVVGGVTTGSIVIVQKNDYDVLGLMDKLGHTSYSTLTTN